MTVTAAAVAGWGKFPQVLADEDAVVLLDLVVAAVTAHIIKNYQVSDPMTDTDELAVIMQCSRIWRRRDTPEGVIAFDELGAVRVSRLDPDVAEMLTPRFGFA